MAVAEVQRVQLMDATMPAWTAHFDRVEGMRERSVIELELGGGPRMLVNVADGQATLLAMGDHEITRRYAMRRRVAADVAGAVPLPAEFSPLRGPSLFPAVSSGPLGQLAIWANEQTAEWVYFLSSEQESVCDEITETIEDVLAEEGTYTLQVIVGGPGTGKTSILLQLLQRLSSQVVDSGETWSIGLRITDRLADYISRATGWNLTESRQLANDQPEVLLVDDPSGLWAIDEAAAEARLGAVRAVVCAFDPLQLDESITDAEYEATLARHGATQHRLSSCYRQKEAPGEYAFQVARVVAESSPFLADAKQLAYASQRREVTGLANTVDFPNPSGFVRTYLGATLDEWASHLQWIRSQPGLWRHWEPLLVILDRPDSLPAEWEGSLARLELARQVVELRDLKRVKGLEYQHVVMILTEARYQSLQGGFVGSGQPRYQEYRLLRIPFSRAKDSIAVFVTQ